MSIPGAFSPVEIDGRPYPVKMGDFNYKVTRSTGKGSNTTTYRLSYLILHLPFALTPDLLIRREGVFDKIAGAIGFDDIDFESAEFSRRFYVKSSDRCRPAANAVGCCDPAWSGSERRYPRHASKMRTTLLAIAMYSCPSAPRHWFSRLPAWWSWRERPVRRW